MAADGHHPETEETYASSGVCLRVELDTECQSIPQPCSSKQQSGGQQVCDAGGDQQGPDWAGGAPDHCRCIRQRLLRE